MIGLDHVWVVGGQHEADLVVDALAAVRVVLDALYGDLAAGPAALVDTPEGPGPEQSTCGKDG